MPDPRLGRTIIERPSKVNAGAGAPLRENARFSRELGRLGVQRVRAARVANRRDEAVITSRRRALPGEADSHISTQSARSLASAAPEQCSSMAGHAWTRIYPQDAADCP